MGRASVTASSYQTAMRSTSHYHRPPHLEITDDLQHDLQPRPHSVSPHFLYQKSPESPAAPPQPHFLGSHLSNGAAANADGGGAGGVLEEQYVNLPTTPNIDLDESW